MRSILSNVPECYLCRKQLGISNTIILTKHHIFFESNRRKMSEQNGWWVYLCQRHHQGFDNEIRHNPKPKDDLELRQDVQKEFEKTHSRDEWMRKVGRNYL